METSEAPPLPPRSPRRLLWQTVAILLVLGLLFANSFAALRKPSARQTDDVSRLALESLVLARTLGIADSPGASVYTARSKQNRQLLDDMERLSRLVHEPNSVRQLALIQHRLSDPNWEATLLRLRDLPSVLPSSAAAGIRQTADSPFDTDRELAMWRQVLDEAPVSRNVVPALREEIRAMKLGWYEHIALVSLYRNAGMTAEASAEIRTANASTGRFLQLTVMMALFGVCGVFLGGCLVTYRWWLSRHPGEAVPAFLQRVPNNALPPPQATALYNVFLAYITGYAFVQMVLQRLLLFAFGIQTGNLSPPQRVLFSLLLLLFWIAIPAGVFLWYRGRWGLRLWNIGFRTANWRTDLFWGIGTYAVALPIVAVVSVLSNALFRNVSSPTHPAISTFSTDTSLLTVTFLFVQAAAFAPLTEETMFRGVFFQALRPRIGARTAILIASSVFALLHPQLPLGFLGLFALGVLFNVVSAWRSSLLPAIVAHSLNNAIICLYWLLVVQG